jgi:DNA replication protein DnaC
MWLAKYRLLIIDELGYVPLSPTGAELLFEVFSQRYERGTPSLHPICRLMNGPVSLAQNASPARFSTA